jgi:hypothetical protein
MRHAGITLLALALSISASGAGPEPSAGVCWDCFWRYHPDSFKRDLIAVYRDKRFADPLADAERRLLLARITGDGKALCAARGAVAAAASAGGAADDERALAIAETLAFTAAECGANPEAAFRGAARAARAAHDRSKAQAYEALARGRFKPRFGDQTIRKRLDLPAEASSFVLGASRIVVDRDTVIGAQVERVARDWLSYQLAWAPSSRALGRAELVPWHEGARIGDILAATSGTVVPLTGTLAARRGDTWYAADERGVFRFEVLDDKIQYPTTLAVGDVALLRDTHGIASLVEPALRSGATLVVGCGDAEGKMKAAYALAARGVDVYFPCDRFVGDVVGHDGRGVLLGSAPVRREGDRAIIGDRPVEFSIGETIVVEDFTGRGEDRYYDAPARYFRALRAFLPSVKLDFVSVEGAGESFRLIRRAAELDATAIAVRVATLEDAAPVRAWLRESPAHRAVLFHSASYPEGNALFAEFPKQTTFGDPRPTVSGRPGPAGDPAGTPAAASVPTSGGGGSRPRTP